IIALDAVQRIAVQQASRVGSRIEFHSLNAKEVTRCVNELRTSEKLRQHTLICKNQNRQGQSKTKNTTPEQISDQYDDDIHRNGGLEICREVDARPAHQPRCSDHQKSE